MLYCNFKFNKNFILKLFFFSICPETIFKLTLLLSHNVFNHKLEYFEIKFLLNKYSKLNLVTYFFYIISTF